jgi:hypothetical protein
MRRAALLLVLYLSFSLVPWGLEEVRAQTQTEVRELPGGWSFSLLSDEDVGGVQWNWTILDYNLDYLVFVVVVNGSEHYRFDTNGSEGNGFNSGKLEFEGGRSVNLTWENRNLISTIRLSYSVEMFAAPLQVTQLDLIICCGCGGFLGMILLLVLLFVIKITERRMPQALVHTGPPLSPDQLEQYQGQFHQQIALQQMRFMPSFMQPAGPVPAGPAPMPPGHQIPAKVPGPPDASVPPPEDQPAAPPPEEQPASPAPEDNDI